MNWLGPLLLFLLQSISEGAFFHSSEDAFRSLLCSNTSYMVSLGSGLTCLPCSSCPYDHYILAPCDHLHNTVCAPCERADVRNADYFASCRRAFPQDVYENTTPNYNRGRSWWEYVTTRSWWSNDRSNRSAYDWQPNTPRRYWYRNDQNYRPTRSWWNNGNGRSWDYWTTTRSWWNNENGRSGEYWTSRSWWNEGYDKYTRGRPYWGDYTTWPNYVNDYNRSDLQTLCFSLLVIVAASTGIFVLFQTWRSRRVRQWDQVFTLDANKLRRLSLEKNSTTNNPRKLLDNKSKEKKSFVNQLYEEV